MLPADRWTFPETRSGRWHFSLSPEIVLGTVKAVDFCLVSLAGATAFTGYLGGGAHNAAEVERYFLTSLLAACLFVAASQRSGSYTLKQLSASYWQLTTRTAAIWATTVSALLFVAFVGKVSETYSRGWALLWIAGGLAAILAERAVWRFAIARWIRQGALARNIVVIGAGELGERLIAKLRSAADRSITIRGVFDDRKSRVPNTVGGCEVLGNTDDLLDFARHVRIGEIIIALPLSAERRLAAIVDKLTPLPADLRLSTEAVAANLPIRGISFVGGVPVVEVVERPIKHWDAVAKWLEDKVLSALLLVALAPVMLVLALLIKLDSRGSVLFVQERFGLSNQVIRVVKFRTMYTDHGDVSGARRTVHNDPRVTRIGRILRWSSLDELPQLFNVIRGDMSLVGPRPHPVAMRAGEKLYGEAVAKYTHRHRVKPGITGWAQINGCRGEIDTLEKARARVEYDLYYVENWSLWLDLKTLALTVPILLSRQNAY